MPHDMPHFDAIIDLRSTLRPRRHALIFGVIERMATGKSFVLVNDHDPRPLHHHLRETYSGMFTWEYLERGPVMWRVRVRKTEDRPDGRSQAMVGANHAETPHQHVMNLRK